MAASAHGVSAAGVRVRGRCVCGAVVWLRRCSVVLLCIGVPASRASAATLSKKMPSPSQILTQRADQSSLAEVQLRAF